MYSYGEGVPEDDVKAVYWYRKAAEQGDAAAQRELRKAYRFLTKGPEEEEIVALGQASATTLRRLAAYEAALARLQESTSSGIGSIPSLI